MQLILNLNLIIDVLHLFRLDDDFPARQKNVNLIFSRAPNPPENDEKSHFEGLGFRPNFYGRSVPPRRSLENYREVRRMT